EASGPRSGPGCAETSGRQIRPIRSRAGTNHRRGRCVESEGLAATTQTHPGQGLRDSHRLIPSSSHEMATSDYILLRAWRRIRGNPPAIIALLVGVFLLVNFLPLWHTDIWGHLKFGQWIVDNRRLPAHEPFCAAADKSAPYVNFQWLSQAGFYLVYHLGERLAGGEDLERTAGGVELLRTLHAVLITLRSALMIIALKRWTGS